MKKLDYLDGLRGIAACAVVFAHFLQIFYPGVFVAKPAIYHSSLEETLSHTPLNIFFNGQAAVCLFFVLSGFVLSHTYFATKNVNLVRSSALRRYVRLSLPVLASSLLVYILLLVDAFFFNDITSITRASLGTDYDSMNTNFLVFLKETLYTTFFHDAVYNPVLWTMKYELLGSFLIFSFLVLFGSLHKRWIMYSLLIVLLFHTYYLAFLIGMLMADIYHLAPNIFKKTNKWYLNIPILATGLFFASFPYVSPVGTIYEFLIMENTWFDYRIVIRILGSAMLISVLLVSHLGQRIFSTKPMIYIGRISFSLYLIHFTILCSLSAYLFNVLEPHMSYNSATLITFLITMPVTWLCAHILYSKVERHSVSISRKVEDFLVGPK